MLNNLKSLEELDSIKTMWDVVVAGAGPAGAIAALVLAQAGCQVLLIDDIPTHTHKIGESLPGASRQILHNLGLLAHIESGSHLPCYGNASAWGTDKLTINDFINDPRGTGWHLDRVQFDETLRLEALRAGAVFSKNRVKEVIQHHNTWKISGKDCQIYSQWWIDATGRSAALAKSQGAICQKDIPLFAIYRWVATSQDDTESRTLIEAAPNGWWYTARLPHQTRVIIFHTNTREATQIQRHPDLWNTYLEQTKHISQYLNKITYQDSHYIIETGGSYLNQVAGHQWIATGDAALNFDPISSQGIFNALYTGMKAGQTVYSALKGDLTAISDYMHRLKTIRNTYYRHHTFIYQSETRWNNNPFWISRKSL
ncbi:MAG: FAD-dependent monooxygenase [Nostoc sp.]|uniref:NAD(P)/FAD-dependent oxidoreductase n=1 Tax=Nostoc sp. TaxID=1180 RepID=UPI002FF7CB42